MSSTENASRTEDDKSRNALDSPRPTGDVSDSDTLAEYFPLRPEDRWEYNVVVSRPGQSQQTSSAVKYLKGTRDIGGRKYSRVVTDASMRAPDQFYRVAENGVYAAVSGAEGKELLVLPARPESKKEWTGEALPVVEDLFGTASVGESWKHGTLEFDDCIKVSLTMTIIERSFLGGRNEVPTRLERWFAPGIGMVRELRIVGEEGEASSMRIDSQLTRWAGTERP